MDFLNDPSTIKYLEVNGVKNLQFSQYFKGCNELGSLVESCVKLTKRLLYGSIKKLVLDYWEFEFFVAQTIHLVNRRPIAFKEGLRDTVNSDIPDPITPELLLKGYTLVSLNIVPDLQSDPEPDPEWIDNPSQKIRVDYEKLKKVRENLSEIYHTEFLGNLVQQAVNVKDRYRPKGHHKLQSGDIVILREPLLKPSDFPMAAVRDVQINDNGEVTGVTAYKGRTRELVKRHVSSVIPLLSSTDELDGQGKDSVANGKEPAQIVSSRVNIRPEKRQAAITGQRNWRQLMNQGRL